MVLRLGFLEKTRLPDLWSRMRAPDLDGVSIRRVSPAVVRGAFSTMMVKLQDWSAELHGEAEELIDNMAELDEDRLDDPQYILEMVSAYRPEKYDAVFRYVVHSTILNGLEDVFTPITNAAKPAEEHLKNFVDLFNRNSYGAKHDSILLTPKQIMYYGERQGCVTFIPDSNYTPDKAESYGNALDMLMTVGRQFAVTACNDMMQYSHTEHEFEMIKHASWDFSDALLDVIEAMHAKDQKQGNIISPMLAARATAADNASGNAQAAQSGAVILAFRPREHNL